MSLLKIRLEQVSTEDQREAFTAVEGNGLSYQMDNTNSSS